MIDDCSEIQHTASTLIPCAIHSITEVSKLKIRRFFIQKPFEDEFKILGRLNEIIDLNE